MKLAIFASLIAGAAAFAPAAKPAASTALNAFDKELGAQMPLGFWDPLGYMKDADQEYFDHLRYVELKHGRVAMLAVVGYLTTYAGVRFPGAEDIPAGFAALPAVPGMVWAQMIATWALMEAANRDQSETFGVKDGWKPDFQGDVRNGYIDFGWDKQTDEWKNRKRAIELNNGRAAQMGILGLMVHDQLGNVATILPLGPQ
uniref:Uncharacterized protein n=1 Tax=Trieres chinensis TaxID=1514140 RepID=A0A7S2A9F9_TRICV|eukprot:CAMPEP_0183291638 /NCGR_PEP_ID=MMETSP0160_2-20130417/984_1 /TAXON_ID=2839 ORGANISM="Odontella Sinensis, Strain Grunow 1884" /NCGR_SAMPLE_ID=MMETSP0160_2 /ASSEMBLY_ACC=CAM_ASM_000250 /LENGTH=200 /DNA_ID=CAMNT_0025452471 /DNA_START=38 /DNA_END=640 /DNA_ORIENTATION=+